MPKHIATTFGESRILEGSFNGDIALKNNYRFLALGTLYVMSLIRDAARPSISILENPEVNGSILIYRITVRDGKGIERNWRMAAFLVNNKNVKEVSVEDIWKFKPRNSIPNYDISDVLSDKDITDTYAGNLANDLLTLTLPRLVQVAANTKESIIRYYSNEIEKIHSKTIEYEKKRDESPSYSRLIEREGSKVQQLKKEAGKKIAQTDRDFDAYPVVELLGISLIVNPSGMK